MGVGFTREGCGIKGWAHWFIFEQRSNSSFICAFIKVSSYAFMLAYFNPLNGETTGQNVSSVTAGTFSDLVFQLSVFSALHNAAI